MFAGPRSGGKFETTVHANEKDNRSVDMRDDFVAIGDAAPVGGAAPQIDQNRSYESHRRESTGGKYCFARLRHCKKIAPDFYAGSQIVTASDASTVAEDAMVFHPTELPSQVDDLDGDSQPDELAFQIDLKPHQTRIVTIIVGTGGPHLSTARRL